MANETIKVTANDLWPLPYISNMQKAVSALRPYATRFNRLSVTGATQEYETDVILETLKTIGKGLSNYALWRKEALEKIESFESAREEMRNIMNIASAMEQSPAPRVGIDPRKLLRLDTISNEIIPWIGSIWFTLSTVNHSDVAILVYTKLTARVLNNLVEVLNGAASVFLTCTPVGPTQFFTCDIKNPDILKFELHDEVVAFSDEEIAEQKRLEEIQAENERRKNELAEAQKRMQSDIDDVLGAYNKHLEIGNLVKFRLTDEAVEVLKHPSSMTDLEKGSGLYKFLMAMSNSVRYMPGEDGPIKDRIMGSFMELEKDVLTYNQQFTLYLHEYGLTHNDIVNALSMFSSANGKIVAQYVDSKEYVEEFMDNPKSPKTLHLFVMC